MQNIRKFEFQKAYEEIEIAGDIYKVDMSDEKVQEYQKAFKSFYVESQKVSETDIEQLTEEQQRDMLVKQKELMKGVTESILGENTFDKLYELAGKSTVNYMELLMFIGSIFEEKTNSVKEAAINKYVKKK